MNARNSPTNDAFPAAALDEGERRLWATYLEPVSLSDGEILFRQGDEPDALFLVESGELAVILEFGESGLAALRRFGPGHFVGEMALYHADRRTATVQSVGTSVLWKLPTSRVAGMECHHPGLALALHRHIAGLLSERVSFANVELKEPLARLAQSLRGLAASDFATTGWDRAGVSEAKSRDDEVGDAARAVDYLETRLHRYLEELRLATAAREAIESELRIAGEIQLSLLPSPLSESEKTRLDFAAVVRPAREAGGDLYDGFSLPDGRFFALVGDVSGKGVSAALFMAMAAMAIRTLAKTLSDPGELLARVNELLCERNETLQFVTACAVLLNPETGAFSWANAGHPLPVILHRDGGVTWLDGPRSAPLGVFEETTYPTRQSQLPPGDTLLLYSDGVNEAMNETGELFGTDRLAALFTGGSPSNGNDVISRVLGALAEHAADYPQSDDITIATLRSHAPAFKTTRPTP